MAFEKTMEKVVALCKGRGFIFQGSEIYGGLANSWDYGPLGVEFKNNVKKAWWKRFIQESPYNIGLGKTRDFRVKWGILEEKTRDLWLKWGICEEKTRDFRLNGGFSMRKRVIFT